MFSFRLQRRCRGRGANGPLTHLAPLGEGQQAWTLARTRRKKCDSLGKEEAPEHRRFSRVNSSNRLACLGITHRAFSPLPFPASCPILTELWGTKMCLPPRLNGKWDGLVLRGQVHVAAKMGLEQGW